MAKYKPTTSFVVIKVLLSIGFTILRRKGSHVRLRHPDGRITSVPAHGKEPIGPGLLLRILKDADISKDEFFALAEKI